MEGYCGKCRGMVLVIVGLVLLINKYLLNWDWWVLLGGLFIIAGIAGMVKPLCGCGQGCCASMETPTVMKKKK